MSEKAAVNERTAVSEKKAVSNTTATNSLAHSVKRGGLVLWLYGLLATAVIAGTYLGTKEQIAQQQRMARERALAQIVPPEHHDNDLLADSFPLADHQLLGHKIPAEAYRARRASEVIAVILPVVATEGYGGAMNIIVGINRDGTLTGVRVLSHNETPGLGDKIEAHKSEWITRFDGRSLSDPAPEQWRVAKDGGEFDQFTGATITPRAVVKAVYQSLKYFSDHRGELLIDATLSGDLTLDITREDGEGEKP